MNLQLAFGTGQLLEEVKCNPAITFSYYYFLHYYLYDRSMHTISIVRLVLYYYFGNS